MFVDNHNPGVGRFKLNNSTIQVKLDLLKPEVENVKPLMSVSEVCQHSKSLIVGHTPNTDVSSNMTYIMTSSTSSPDGLTILIIIEATGQDEHVRGNN